MTYYYCNILSIICQLQLNITLKWVQGLDLNQRPQGYEPCKLTGLLYPAIWRIDEHVYGFRLTVIINAVSILRRDLQSR